jgi:GT2 family glycosyltransferase
VSILGLHAWRLAQRLRGNATLSPRRFSVAKRVDWTTGACMLVRRAAIEQVGVMDDGFFLYYEDVDWCRLMAAAGWQVLVEPTALCVHHLGGSGGGASPLLQQSLERYCAKYGLHGLAVYARLNGFAKGLLKRHS